MKGALADRIQNLFSKVQEGLVTANLGPLGMPAFAARDEIFGILRGVVLENIEKMAILSTTFGFTKITLPSTRPSQ